MGFFPFETAAGTIPVYEPSGGDDAPAINGILASGKPLFLLPQSLLSGGRYLLGEPVNQWQSGQLVDGFQWWAASPADNYGIPLAQTRGGAVLEVLPTFPNGQYAFDLFNAGAGQNYGIDISGINLYGWNIPDTSDNVGLIRVDGAWAASFLRGVGFIGATGDVAHFQSDGTTGKVPDDWQITGCKFSGSLNGYGFWTDDLPDSWIDNCESSENKLDNWRVGFSTNSRFSNSKGENSSTANDWHFTGLGVDNVLSLVNCTSQFAFLDGFLFDNGSGAGTGLGSYVLAGCASTHDAQSGAGWASYDSEGCKSRVMLSGCLGTGAQYGAYEGAASYYLQLTGCFVSGTTAATHDDGTNTHPLANTSPVAF